MSVDVKPAWATALEAFNAENSSKGMTRKQGGRGEEEEEEAGTTTASGLLGEKNVGAIPRFYKRKISDKTFDSHVKVATIHEYVQSFSERLLSSWNLEGIWDMIVQNSEEHPESKDKFMTYAGVSNMADSLYDILGPLLSFHFTPSKFLSFRRNPVGGVSSVCYFTAICRRNLRLQIKLILLRQDKEGNGMISVDDLETVLDEILDKNIIQDIPLPQSAFRTTWKQIALHKFVVHLLKTRNVSSDEKCLSIKAILKSQVFREFTELPTMSLNIFYSGPMGKKVAANWFSLQHAQRINRAFSNLDQDKDGFITKEEFRKLEPGMTDIFVDRIFGEHVNAFNCTSTTSGKSPPKPSLKRRSSVMLMRQEIAKQKISKRGCMSFSDYLTFAMCWNDKRHPYSLKYFFTCLDLERRGFLTHVEIHSFFREVFAKYLENNQYNDIRMEDVRDEIFDMVTQQVPGKITQKDILNSGVQDVLVDVLSDYNGFWRYDNREYLMQMEDEEEQ